VLLLGLLGVRPALAQRLATLRGTVTDSLSGQPLAGVSVGLLGQAGGTATDALGQFRLRQIAAGTYQLRLGALGYKLKNREMALAPG
jgi:protocatechuate 3,4-dioxygenase beta subunit